MSLTLIGSNPSSKRLRIEIITVAVLSILMLVVMPMLNSAGVVSNFTINVWGKYFSYALLAISVDMLWGFMGLLSLGQSIFFSLGGYMMGMYLMRMIGGEGVPTFLSMVGRTEWPAFFEPFSSFPFAMLMVLLVPGILAFVFGYLAFRSRIKGVYFSILTQALTYGAALMFFQNDMLMGGNNGFTDFRYILGFDVRQASTLRGLYIATGVTLLMVYILLRWLNSTRFGLIQRAIRDSENRVLFSGYAASHYKLFIFVLAAMVAAIGGALYVPQVGIINPAEMQTDKSLEAVVWVAVGGRGTLLGPIIGAISVNALKSWATVEFPDLWLFMLGGSFMLIVLFMPKGIVGIPAQVMGIYQAWKKKRDFALELASTPAKPSDVAPPTPSTSAAE